MIPSNAAMLIMTKDSNEKKQNKTEDRHLSNTFMWYKYSELI